MSWTVVFFYAFYVINATLHEVKQLIFYFYVKEVNVLRDGVEVSQP
jgi:hypothetical protein